MQIFNFFCVTLFVSVNSVFTSTDNAKQSKPISDGNIGYSGGYVGGNTGGFIGASTGGFGGAGSGISVGSFSGPGAGSFPGIGAGSFPGIGAGSFPGIGAGSFAGSSAGAFNPYYGVNNAGSYQDYPDYGSFSIGDRNGEVPFVPGFDAIHQQNLMFHDQLTASILGQNAFIANQASQGQGGVFFGNVGNQGGNKQNPGFATFVGGSTSVGPDGVQHVSFVYPPNSNGESGFGANSKPGSNHYSIQEAHIFKNTDGKLDGDKYVQINDNGKITSDYSKITG